jgi:RND family efflux transporter MFP subunit
MKRIFFALFGLAILAGIAYVGLKVKEKLDERAKGPAPRPAPQVPVEVAPVSTITLRDVRRYSGSIENNSSFIVSPQVGGRLNKLYFDVGDAIRRGDLVAELDDRDFITAVEKAKSDLAVAEAGVKEYEGTIETARRELERVKALHERKFASDTELDTAKQAVETLLARLGVAIAQVEQKKTALREAELRLTYTKVRALWEGDPETRTIGEKYAEQGTLLSQNSPIVSVVDIATVKAVIQVSEVDFALMAVGKETTVKAYAYGDRTFTGSISRIAPQFSEASRQVRVEITVSNAEGLLRPGMYITVEILRVERRNVAAVPLDALVKRNGEQGVFVLSEDGKKAVFLKLTLGISDDKFAEVLSPAISGPIVVVGQHLLADGIGVRVLGGKEPDGRKKARPAEDSGK